MTMDDQIRDEKLQYDINRAAAKISGLPWGKISRNKHLTGDEILLTQQHTLIEEVKFSCFHLGKAFEKQLKTIEQHRKRNSSKYRLWILLVRQN